MGVSRLVPAGLPSCFWFGIIDSVRRFKGKDARLSSGFIARLPSRDAEVETQPDSIDLPLTISRSTAFRHLQARIGLSTYRLNTVLVGLECVAVGQGDGGAIAVTWKKPETPEQARQVANQARAFACTSALVLGADVFDSFLREFADEAWLGFSENARDIAGKKKTRSQDQGGAYSVAERAESLCEELELDDPPSIAVLDLLAKWRNVVAHSSERSIGLESKRKEALLTAAEAFHDLYSNLDIELAIKNFQRRATPVHKEATTLVAIAVNFSRKIDEAAIKRSASTPEKMSLAANHMLRSYFESSPDREIDPWSELSEAWQGGVDRRRKKLIKIFQNLGIAEHKTPISAPLPADFLEGLLVLDREDVAQQLGILRE